MDVDFVRRAVRAVGQAAIKIESAAERCVSVLMELIETRVSYVVQEAVIVIKVCSFSWTPDFGALDKGPADVDRTFSENTPIRTRASSPPFAVTSKSSTSQRPRRR